ncbi:c-type cytochrome [Membranihabitans marinus]|uniref:c-type cytochrome n=1 Tax=Membranihabitans marinus TaxID=1227546 RepID=UPI001F2B881A|nr:cytochrome c [Membranihabitans marinus]
MKRVVIFLSSVAVFCMISCGSEGGEQAAKTETKKEEVKSEPSQADLPASKRVDLENKGIGPITEVDLPSEIDRKLSVKGKEIYSAKCIACHSVDKKIIGPPQKGILDRRTPEWVMNMIMNPTEMLEKDPLAKDLLAEFNNTPMLDQNITEEEARALLEYFRTL